MEGIRRQLELIHELLRQSDDEVLANVVEDALEAPEPGLSEFLQSNELWGGAGSVADQGFFDSPSELRRRGMRAMVELGQLQIARNIVNVRTRMWTEVFREWLNRA